VSLIEKLDFHLAQHRTGLRRRSGSVRDWKVARDFTERLCAQLLKESLTLGKGETNRTSEKYMLTSLDGTVISSSKLSSRDTAAVSSYEKGSGIGDVDDDSDDPKEAHPRDFIKLENPKPFDHWSIAAAGKADA
jgi:hypothetical protein